MHPFTSLTLWAVVVVTSFVLPLPWLAGLAGLTCTALLAWPVSRSRWRVVAALVVPLAVSLWLVHGGVVSQWLGGLVGDADTRVRVAALWLRLLAIVAAAQIWLAAVPTSRFVRALFASHLPPGLCCLLAGPLLLTEQLRDQLRLIREAQIARGVPLDGSALDRLRSLPALIMPLLTSALQDMTTRSAALDARAFRAAPRRTTLWAPPDTPRQQALRWTLVGVMLAEICIGVWMVW